VICVSKSSSNYVVSLLIVQLLFINQDSEKFNCSDSWVSIIKLDLVLLRKEFPISVGLLESSDQVSDSCTTEEILLLKS
jgi:hypothetical protein